MSGEWIQWPLMEEEILIIENKKNVVFNIPYSLYKNGLENHLKDLHINKIYTRQDPLGGPRIILILDKQNALELKAWITLQLSKSSHKYFVTDLEEI